MFIHVLVIQRGRYSSGCTFPSDAQGPSLVPILARSSNAVRQAALMACKSSNRFPRSFFDLRKQIKIATSRESRQDVGDIPGSISAERQPSACGVVRPCCEEELHHVSLGQDVS